eukprot:TRINITY_DN10639_c0_g1_i1.p1 TRINITY_DN10639_c0_g1~~TRINITY_DN10639_c0_g1_i1.p1  ORF type:complete len:746 (+),score=195.33 TRINITY_DN10639_c0_g1_i1:3-2240(+)
MAVWLAFSLVALACAEIDVDISDPGSYQITVDGHVWLNGFSTSVRVDNKTYSTEDGLLMVNQTSKSSGFDATGHFNETAVTFQNVPFEVYVRKYANHLVFGQFFPQAIAGTNTSSGAEAMDYVSSSFPAFDLSKDPATAVGLFSFQSDMMGSGARAFSFSSAHDNIGTGTKGSGPLVIFAKDLSRSLVISSYSNFMIHNMQVEGKALKYGPMGTVRSIPQGFTIETVVVASTGISQAMEEWGNVLLAQYGREREAYKRDYTLNVLGYSTDNGAYYYYQTEPHKNYEDTLLDVYAYAQEEQIPYKYILLDSWWYYQDPHGSGVTEWDARPDVFPHGLDYFFNKTGWYQQLHNRFWSVHNVYATQNGGDYDFDIDDDGFAVPLEQRFWDDLLAAKRKSGAINYEQDWLDDEFDHVTLMHKDVNLARQWLMQMGRAATTQGQTIQYCMSHPRHIMQAVEIPAVTNARASGDYHPGNGQWDTTRTAIFGWAVGVAPSKDNFWSTPIQPGTHYGNDTAEHRGRLQAAMSILTTGPVAPSDMVGGSNPALIATMVTKDGLLLQPDRPLRQLDAVIAQEAFASDGLAGVVAATSSELAPEVRVSYVVGVNVKQAGSVSPADLGYPADTKLMVAEINHTNNWTDFTSETPLKINTCEELDFQYYIATPVLPNGWAFVGEPNKWVSASRRHFADLVYTEQQLTVKATGVMQDEFSIMFVAPEGSLVTVQCPIGATNTVRIGVDFASRQAICEDA